jgi:glycosyltransferase involved in cell wall biosynthesis
MDLRGGGAERVMLNLAGGLSDCGFRVDLVLVQAVGEYCEQIPPGVRLVHLDAPRLVAAFGKLYHYLRQTRPKTMISALEDTNILAIAAKQVARVDTRLIVTVHNQLSQEIKHARNLKRRWVPHLLRWIYPGADAVVGVSQGVVADLHRLGIRPQQTQVIYNPIVTPELLQLPAQAAVHPWFAPGQPPVILAVGRLNEQKDFATLLHAFAQVRARRPARLMILGEGSERDRLTQLAQALGVMADVSLPGFVPNPQVYMQQASLLALSSAWEGFGNVLVEAMAVGTPVVATNCESGPAEILRDGQYGALTPVGDATAMAQAIDRSLNQPIAATHLQQRSLDFSLATITAQYQQLLGLSDAGSQLYPVG